MAWFKVDDGLDEHPKALAAGVEAMGLWVLAGSYAGRNLTDGFVPKRVLNRWVSAKRAHRLALILKNSGLWDADTVDGVEGYRFHDWADRNPTRAQKAAEHRARSDAGRIGGIHSGKSRREASAKQTASALVELPSRPVPTRPVNPPPIESVSQRLDSSRRAATTTGLDLNLICSALGRNVSDEQARLIAWEILSRAKATPGNPTGYVVAAIGLEPERYRPAELARVIESDPCSHGYSNAILCPFCRREQAS